MGTIVGSVLPMRTDSADSADCAAIFQNEMRVKKSREVHINKIRIGEATLSFG